MARPLTTSIPRRTVKVGRTTHIGSVSKNTHMAADTAAGRVPPIDSRHGPQMCQVTIWRQLQFGEVRAAEALLKRPALHGDELRDAGPRQVEKLIQAPPGERPVLRRAR